MKNRDYKKFAPNCYYHIFNRGNGKQEIYKDSQDYLNFLKRLKLVLGVTASTRVPLEKQGEPLLRIRSLPTDSFSVICYCLMPNHFHFLIRQNTEIPISKMILKVCTSYSAYFNKKYERVGGLFEDAFKAIVIVSDAQLLWLSAYIHNNPRTAGLVTDLNGWRWSSYLDFLGLRQGTLCDPKMILEQYPGAEAYKKFADNAGDAMRARKELESFLLD